MTDLIWNGVATERRRLADELDALTDEQWRTQSRCEEWTVGEVAAHLILPFEASMPRFALKMARHRGNLDKVMIDLTEWVSDRNGRAEIVAKLRANAEAKWTPPGYGPEMPLAEVIVHGQDIRRSLGLDHDIPAETIELALTSLDDDDLRADYAERIGVALPNAN
jgi:uncharacterized protein (TIGR03083 family)